MQGLTFLSVQCPMVNSKEKIRSLISAQKSFYFCVTLFTWGNIQVSWKSQTPFVRVIVRNYSSVISLRPDIHRCYIGQLYFDPDLLSSLVVNPSTG